MAHKNENLKESVARALHDARLKAGLSQGDIAAESSLKTSNISRIESGSQNLSLDTIEKYCLAMNLRPVFEVEEDVGVYDAVSDYELCIYDECLIRFVMERHNSDIKVKITWVADDKKNLLPVSLRAAFNCPEAVSATEALRLWLKRRPVPQSRAYVYEMLKSVGLGRRDVKGIIDISRGLSLDDSYWVKSVNSAERFDEVNLFENSFSAQLGQIAFVGMYQPVPKTSSPEFTTGGMLRKGWRRPPGKQGVWLYKGGSEAASGYAGFEPYSEYYASAVAQAMGLNAVYYDLEQWNGILASCCPLFTTKDISYVPAAEIDEFAEIEDVISYYKELGPRYYDELCDMLVFDSLILNCDRHFGNFGLLRDNRTGSFISPAPIFDNGQSLFAHSGRDDFSDMAANIARQNNPYERNWEEILGLALGARQKQQLKRMKNFTMPEHPCFNLPEWRIHMLEDFLRSRAEWMCKEF